MYLFMHASHSPVLISHDLGICHRSNSKPNPSRVRQQWRRRVYHRPDRIAFRAQLPSKSQARLQSRPCVNGCYRGGEGRRGRQQAREQGLGRSGDGPVPPSAHYLCPTAVFPIPLSTADLPRRAYLLTAKTLYTASFASPRRSCG